MALGTAQIGLHVLIVVEQRLVAVKESLRPLVDLHIGHGSVRQYDCLEFFVCWAVGVLLGLVNFFQAFGVVVDSSLIFTDLEVQVSLFYTYIYFVFQRCGVFHCIRYVPTPLYDHLGFRFRSLIVFRVLVGVERSVGSLLLFL